MDSANVRYFQQLRRKTVIASFFSPLQFGVTMQTTVMIADHDMDNWWCLCYWHRTGSQGFNIFLASVGRYIVFGRTSNRFQPNPWTQRYSKQNRLCLWNESACWLLTILSVEINMKARMTAIPFSVGHPMHSFLNTPGRAGACHWITCQAGSERQAGIHSHTGSFQSLQFRLSLRSFTLGCGRMRAYLKRTQADSGRTRKLNTKSLWFKMKPRNVLRATLTTVPSASTTRAWQFQFCQQQHLGVIKLPLNRSCHRQFTSQPKLPREAAEGIYPYSRWEHEQVVPFYLFGSLH